MYSDNNSATLSVRYINAQLSALWENAQECVRSSDDPTFVNIKSEEYEKEKHTRALAQFHLLGHCSSKGPFSKDGLFFVASFDKPRIDFACNHEAVLRLKLKTGHLSMEYKKVEEPDYCLNRSYNVPFEGLDVAFRMRFNRQSIDGKGSKIGKKHVVQAILLDYATAKMTVARPDRHLSMSHDIQDALEFYLRQYLTFLHSSGAHTLFDLPNFDNDKYSPSIDYSINNTVLGIEELSQDIEIFGISVPDINNYLRNTWMKIGSLASGIFGSVPTDHLSTCLYEIKSTWLLYPPSTHFHIKFGPPTVQALCSHEVVLYFTLEELSFYKTGLFNIASGGYSRWDDEPRWKIAFVVDVAEVKEADGCVTRIMLDLKSARFSQQLSLFHYQDVEHFNSIVDFMKTTYITLLMEYKFFDIYSADIRIPNIRKIDLSNYEWTPREPTSPEGPKVPFTWAEMIEQITLGGFDQAMAISEGSINALFKSWWNIALKGSRNHRLYSYSNDYIQVTFRPSHVRLLNGNRAIIWVTIDDGHLLLEQDNRQFDCSGWSVAYEVDIKMVDHRDMQHDAWDDRFKNAAVLTAHGHHEHRHIRHIVFDFSHAKFSYELSSLKGIFVHGADVALRRLKSMTGAVHEYLRHLTITGHNIIHSVPIFQRASADDITDISIQVVSQAPVTVLNVSHVHQAPVLLVLAIFGHRPIPNVPLSWGRGWIIPPRQGDISYGTIYLSSSLFLEGHILRLLEHVNRRTTVVPRFPTEEEDDSKVYLTTWDQHHHRSNKECRWAPSNEHHADWLEYSFEHKEVRDHSYEMSGVHPEFDEYSVFCHTRNQLLIPTTYYPDCVEIIIRGYSLLHLKGKSEPDSWSNYTYAAWEASISIYTTANGLRIKVSKAIEPTFSEPALEGKFAPIDVLRLHRQSLPGMIKLDDLLGELRVILENEWNQSYPSGTCYTLASPVFKHNGDFIAQVRTQDPYAKPLDIPDPRQMPSTRPALPPFAPPPAPFLPKRHAPTPAKTPATSQTAVTKPRTAPAAPAAKPLVVPPAPVAKPPAAPSVPRVKLPIAPVLVARTPVTSPPAAKPPMAPFTPPPKHTYHEEAEECSCVRHQADGPCCCCCCCCCSWLPCLPRS